MVAGPFRSSGLFLVMLHRSLSANRIDGPDDLQKLFLKLYTGVLSYLMDLTAMNRAQALHRNRVLGPSLGIRIQKFRSATVSSLR